MKHRHTEKEQVREESDRWNGEYLGFEFLIYKSKDRCEISIYEARFSDRLRMGIVSLHPESVSAIEAFAENASDILKHIAKEMRSVGLDDLRSDFEKLIDKGRHP